MLQKSNFIKIEPQRVDAQYNGSRVKYNELSQMSQLLDASLCVA